MTPLIEFIRASVRPVISIMFAAVMAQAVIEGITLPAWFLSLAIPCITWWFIDRTLQHRKNGGNNV